MAILPRLDLGDLSVTTVIATIAFALTLGILVQVFHNVFINPLSRYPGPRLAGATRLWYCYHCVRGTLRTALFAAHEKYGLVVRIAPNELSFTDPGAFNDIYGHRPGKPEIMKDPTFYSSQSSGQGSIINAIRARHGPLRKQASYGFSEKALRSQEHVIKRHAALFIERLKENAASKNPTVDIVDWFNFFTFDVMGDLVIGQSFDCLNSGYHPWVKLIFDSVKATAFVRCAKYWPILAPMSTYLVPPEVRKRRVAQRKMAADKAAYRKSLKDGRQDLISGYLLPDSGVSDQEYRATLETLVIAGSETTATLMSGVTYHLLRNPDQMAKVTAEIRTAFSTADEIDLTGVNKLPYLLACLDEGLRIYPPVPDTFPRNTGPREEIICGQVVPAWTVVGVPQWCVYHSSRNFQDPDKFRPERWLEGDNGYATDNKQAVQPFLVGPRNCLGRNLAYVEMRVLMARLLWHFDMELDPQSFHWDQQKTFILWEKPPMMVKLRTRSQ